MAPHVYVDCDFDDDEQTLGQWRASRRPAKVRTSVLVLGWLVTLLALVRA